MTTSQLELRKQRVNRLLKQHLPPIKNPLGRDRLTAAMHYAIQVGGKRLRPLLVYATGETLGATPAQCDLGAVAIELMHTYSLVHDDLPAMDDDDLRRGQPSCHKKFDEATAILVGDALQALSFSVLAEGRANLSCKQRLAMLQILAKASGAEGMVAGQALDLAVTGQNIDLSTLKRLHALKTGALFQASIQLGIQAANCRDPQPIAALTQFADCLGLAFQIQDDVLDRSSSTATLGKAQGSDLKLNKPTFAAHMPLEKAKQLANDLYQQAREQLDKLASSGSALILILDRLENRDH